MKYKLVAFDLDGTLLVGKSSWWKLHEYFGTIDWVNIHDLYKVAKDYGKTT